MKSFGQVHYCEKDYWPHNTGLYATDFHGNDPRFAFYFLDALDFRRYNSGGAQQSLNRNFIYPIPVAVPPLAEQRPLAQALSDVDALIASLDKLIAKKRNLKTATMQQLLTGKKRLPGFGEGKGYKQSAIGVIPEDWDIRQLGEVADIDSENLGSTTHPEYSFKYISLEDVNRGVLNGYSEQIFSSSPSHARRVLRYGDVLFSTVRPNLKSHLIFQENDADWVCSTGFSVLEDV